MDNDQISKLMLGGTNPIVEVNDQKTQAAIAKLNADVIKLSGMIRSDLAEELKEIRKLTNVLTKQYGSSNSTAEGKFDNRIEKNTAYTAKNTQKMWKASQGQGSTFWVGISKFSNEAERQLSKALGKTVGSLEKVTQAANQASSKQLQQAQNLGRNMNKALSKSTGSSSSGSRATPGLSSVGSLASTKALNNTTKSLGKIGMIVAGITSSMNRLKGVAEDVLDFKPASIVFDGLIKNSIKFNKNMRAIIHQQQGFDVYGRKAEENYRNILSDYMAAGGTMEQYQAMYLKNLQRGLPLNKKNIKDNATQNDLMKARLDTLKSIQTSALNVANELSLSADATNEMFMDWGYNLNLSSVVIAEMGQNMKSLARQTGVTGDRLTAAMQKVNQMYEKMYDVGGLTSRSAGAAMDLAVAGSKFGGKGTEELLEALTSTEGFMNSKMAPMLMRAASRTADPAKFTNAVRTSSVLNMNQRDQKELFSKVKEEPLKIIAPFTKTLEEFGYRGEQDIKNLSQITGRMSMRMNDENISKEERFKLGNTLLAIESQFKGLGMSIGSVSSMARSLDELGKTTFEKINELAKTTEGLTGVEKQRAEAVLNEMKSDRLGKAFSRITDFSMDLQGGWNANVEKKISDSLTGDLFATQEESMAFLKDLQNNAGTLLTSFENRAKEAGLDFGKLLADRGVFSKEELIKGLQSGDVGMLEKLQSTMQEMSRDAKASQDPMTKMEDALNKVHAQLSTWGVAVTGAMGTLTVAVLTLTSVLGSIIPAVAAMRGAGGLFGPGGLGGGWFGGSNGPRGSVPVPGMPSGPGGPGMPNMPSGSNGPRGNPAGGSSGKPGAASGAPPAPKSRWQKAKGFGSKFKPRGAGKFAAIGSLLGGVLGYAASDEENAWQNAALGAAGGGLGGFALGKLRGAGGAAATGMNPLGYDGMGTPVPVIIVGGMPGGMGMGGMVQNTLLAADVASNVADLTGVGSKADDTAKAMSKVAGVGDEATKSAGWLSRMATKIPGASKLGSAMSIGGKIAGKVAAPLDLVLGGATGYMEAESTGRSKLGATALGTLTGDASTGSMLSPMMGIEQGSVADEAMGVLGAGGRGALIGAAVGSIIPGVGTAIGAAVGGVVGAGAEVLKIFTAEESSLRDGFFAVNQMMFDKAKETASWAWDGIKSAGATIVGAVSSAGSYVLESAKSAGSWIMDTSTSVVNSVWDGIKSVGSTVSSMTQKGAELIQSTATGFVGGIGAAFTGWFGLGEKKEGEMETAKTVEMTADNIIIRQISRDYESTGNRKVGILSTNAMDYRDEIRGTASTLLSPKDLEARVLQSKMGAERNYEKIRSGDPEALLDYITGRQDSHFMAMIDELKMIRQALMQQPSGNPVAPLDTSMLANGTGLKSLARKSKQLGQWDIGFADYSPTAITTEGRR